MVERVSGELADIRESDDGMAGQELYEHFAELYRENLSHLKPQIIVQGEQPNLGDAHIVARIRTSLLAGVRAGVLLAQLGGSRWQILLQRRRYMDNAARLLNEIEPRPESQTLH
jgi:high frequency lysogenization protein